MAAPAVDDAGAAALKPRLAETLKLFTDSLAQQGYLVKQEGEMTVEAAGTYYAVTTPILSLALPNGATRSIGMVAINAIPTDDPDIIKVAIAIPTPIVDKDPNGKPLGQITIGNQALSGQWHLAGAAFVQLDARYANIVAVDTLNATETKVPSLAIAMQLQKAADGKWTGPSEIIATNYSHRSKDGTFQVADARMKSKVTSLDLTARPAAPEKKGDAADFKVALANAISKMADGLDTNVALTGITASVAGEGGKTNNLTVKSVTFASTLKDALKGNPATSVAMAVEGMGSDDPAITPYLPTVIKFNGTAQGVGLDTLMAANSMEAIKKKGAVSKLDSFVIDAPAYGLTALGNFNASGEGVGGGMKITLRGITDLMTFLSSPDAPKVNGQGIPPVITGILGMVQMLGKPEADAQGRAALVYDFRMAQEGKLTLNGTDLSAILQGMQGGAKGAIEAAPNSAPSAPAAP